MVTLKPTQTVEAVTVNVSIKRETFEALLPLFLPSIGGDLAILKALVVDLVADRKAGATRADLLEILDLVEDLEAQTNGGR